MTNREEKLLAIIRGSKDPAALMTVAAQVIIACRQQPEPFGSPCPAAPASIPERDQ